MESFISQYDDNDLFSDVDAKVFRNRFIVRLEDNGLMEFTRDNILKVPV